MIVTEKEAAQKWCTEGRLAAQWREMGPIQIPGMPASGNLVATATVNILPDGQRVSCAGTKCMFWDWLDGEECGEDRRGFCRKAYPNGVDE